MDNGNGYPSGLQIQPNTFKECRNRSFTRAISGGFWQPTIGSETGDYHKLAAALRDHLRRHSSHTVCRAEHVYVDHTGDIVRLHLGRIGGLLAINPLAYAFQNFSDSPNSQVRCD